MGCSPDYLVAPAGAVLTVFSAAFVLYELVLYAASFILPGSAEAFSFNVVSPIVYVNALALAALLFFHRLGVAVALMVGELRRPEGRNGTEERRGAPATGRGMMLSSAFG